MTNFIKSSVNLQRSRITNFNNIFMKKPSLIILLVLLSCELFGQTLKTTIDNSILGQGTKGISALKLRNVFATVADSVSDKVSKSKSYCTYAFSSTNTYVATSADAGKTIVVPTGSNITTVSTSNIAALGLSTIIENRKNTMIFSTGINGIWAYYSQIPAFSSQIIYLDSEGAFQTKQFNYPVSGLESATFNTSTGNFEFKNIEDETATTIPLSTFADNRYLQRTGGTITGNLLLNTVVKAGGSSTFENTWLGQDVLNSVTSGTQNVGIGKNTLKAITGGSWNTGLGYKSLEFGTTATKNSAVGAYSLNSTTTGQYNTAIGYEAGKLNTTGYYNTFLGGFTGVGYETSSGRIWISDGLGNVRISVTNTGNVGIGTKDATSPLQIIDLPVFSSNSSAISAGLTAGAVYRSSTGFLMIVY